jgi:hypothetical protein
LKNSKRDYSKTESFHIGPQLPDHLTREKSYNKGPSLPPDIQPKGDNSSSDDDNDVIGPLPCEMLILASFNGLFRNEYKAYVVLTHQRWCSRYKQH